MESRSSNRKRKIRNYYRSFFVYFIIFLFVTPIFSQTWNFHGEGIVDPYYVWILGDRSLFETQNSFYPGLNYQLKGRFSFSQISKDLSLNLNFVTGYTPSDQISVNIKSQNFEGVFGNNFQESLSYLTLWNKNVNGVELKYIDKKFSLKGFLVKIESTKKQKSFYGNNTSGPYILSDFYLVPGKEKVYLNGKLLERDVDYIIDYSYGILYFTEIISSEDLVIVEYEVRGITPQIYNLLGLNLEYLPLSLTFLNVDDPYSKINRKFIELSLLSNWQENYINLSLSQSLLENIFTGKAYNLALNYKDKNFSISGQSLKVDEDYPYFKEVLGNFEIIPGIFRNKINLSYKPYTFLNYTLNFLREDYKTFNQNIQQNLSIDLSKFSISGVWNNEIKDKEKDTKRLTLEYKDIPSSFYIQEYKEGDRREITKNFSFTPQSSYVKININHQVKDIYTSDTLLLTQNINQFYINIFSPKLNLSLGETYQSTENFNPNLPLETSQIFISDGYQWEFTLTYTPLPDSIKVYINSVYVENGGTFTYFLPSEEPITYTVEIGLIDKTLQIFFIDESGKNPPPSGLVISITYKYFLPEKSYSKKDDFALTFRWNRISISPKYSILEKDGSVSKILSLSLYGELIPKMWINLSYNQYFDEGKKNLSLNISYRPSFLEFYQTYNYQETPISLFKNLSLTGKINTSFFTLQGNYNFRDSIYSSYILTIRNFNVFGNFNLFGGKCSLSYFNEERKSNQNISNYLSSAYSLSYNKNFLGVNLNYSLTRENYIDLSFKWKNLLEIFPLLNNKSKIFLENIYYEGNNNFYSSWRLGTQLVFRW